jgi:Tol biopolymer transport system component
MVFGFTLMMNIFIVVIHGIYQPLPGLLYAHNNQQSLHRWQADCPSPLTICVRQHLVRDGLNIHPVAQWSPDGNFIAVFLKDGWAIYPVDCLLGDGSCKPTRLEPLANDNRIAWGPEGSTLAYITNTSSGQLRILTRGCWDKNLQQQCLRQSIDILPDGVLRQAAWSADGSQFAFQGLVPSGLFALDSACLDEPETCDDALRSVAVSLAPIYWPSLSANGRQILYFANVLDGVEQLYISDAYRDHIQQVTFREGGASMPAWSMDGRYIAFAGFQNGSSGDLGIYILDRERTLIARAIFEQGQDIVYPSWNTRP